MMMMWPMVAVPRFHKKRTIEPLLGDGWGGGGWGGGTTWPQEEDLKIKPEIDVLRAML